MASDEKPFVILIPSYNNIEWWKTCLESVLFQNYRNFRIVYIDDCSTDGTGEAVAEYIRANKLEDRVNFIRNSSRQRALANIYSAVQKALDDEIVALLDGDDLLLHDGVLKLVNSKYQEGVLLTYGGLISYPSGKRNPSYFFEIPKEIIHDEEFRKIAYPSHLRTFYTWLFKKVKKEDLCLDGNFFQAAYDLALMLPMLEMAAEKHAYIDESIYLYNEVNPLNVYKTNREHQFFIEQLIRSKPPYRSISI